MTEFSLYYFEHEDNLSRPLGTLSTGEGKWNWSFWQKDTTKIFLLSSCLRVQNTNFLKK